MHNFFSETMPAGVTKMAEIITASQFEVRALPWVPGEKMIREFGFDPDKCVITIVEDCLKIEQEGFNSTFAAGPGFWRRVPQEEKAAT